MYHNSSRDKKDAIYSTIKTGGIYEEVFKSFDGIMRITINRKFVMLL